jgi:hypothetical protein
MNTLTRYLTNVTQVKTGLSRGVLIGYAAQALLGLLTAILGLITIFFVFDDWLGFGATATSLGMFFLFLALLIGSVVGTNSAKAHTVENARRALGSRGSSALRPASSDISGDISPNGRRASSPWRQTFFGREPCDIAAVAPSGDYKGVTQ